MYSRPQKAVLLQRLRQKRRFLHVLAGPRQVGKTTLVQQVLEELDRASHYATADEPALKGGGWIEQQWEVGRLRAREAGGAVLALDEVQKLSGWAEAVKRLWDEDTRRRTPLQVVLLGSAPLLMQRGLGESLAGRFETIHLPHWGLAEMQAAFGWDLERFLVHGGYPGPAELVDEPGRWRSYVRESLIEPTISRDVLLLERVDKPALLRRLFEVGCAFSGQVLSYQKMLGQLQDAGNTTTLAHYLDLLAAAGLLAGLQKYAGTTARQRGSSPKLQVFDNGLMTAQTGLTPQQVQSDREARGRLVESAVGAHLAAAAAAGTCELFWWRHRHHEVDFVVRARRRVTAIEVKSGRTREALPGLEAFAAAHRVHRKLLVGGDGVPLEEFLTRPVEHWLAD